MHSRIIDPARSKRTPTARFRVPRADRVDAFLSYGFRPFFLCGAGYAAIAMLVWLALFRGALELPSAFSPRDWHIHEMLYGYLPAVITGFLLTAIPNWTGRLPVRGLSLLLLVIVWTAGRLAVAASEPLGWFFAAFIDCSFLLLVAAAAAREIIAGRNWRNLKVLIPVVILGLGNLFFHLEAHAQGVAVDAVRVGVAAVVILITLIGGRIVPSFTRNWLVRENPGRLPAPFGKFDSSTVLWSIVTLVVWIAWPTGTATAFAMLAAGALQAVRLFRWAGDRTMRDPLVLVLHVGYAFVPLGFLLTALSAFAITPSSAGLHAWMVGAAGLMTLGVMTRASLGHTGRALAASRGTQALFAALLAAAIARVAAALPVSWTLLLLDIAAFFWIVGFAGFCALYAPALWSPRRSNAPGEG